MSATTVTSTRSARLGLRATPEQEAVLRRAADVAHKSLTDFVYGITSVYPATALGRLKTTYHESGH